MAEARTILHLHVPAFPIALARLSRPELRGRPVAVAPPCSQRALLLCVSREARREGLYKGLALDKALRRCPQLAVLPPDRELTERVCRVLGRIAAGYTPLWEPARPGHLYLDISGTRRLWGPPQDTAERLRREVKERLGLLAGVGLAGNKMVAAIASHLIRGAGLMDVQQGSEARFLAPLPVGMLPGIGRRESRMLREELAIFRIRELAALEPERLKVLFGRRGPLIHRRSLGIDPSPVRPVLPRRVQEEITLCPDENDDQRLLGTLLRLVETCAYRLRRQGLVPRRAGLLLRYSDGVEISRRIVLPRPSAWDFELYAPLHELFIRVATRRVRVRLLRVWFAELALPGNQLSLFERLEEERARRMILALDRIRERHGLQAVHMAAASLGGVGT